MNSDTGKELKRIRVIYGIVVLVCLVFVARLFYLQVIRYSYYQGQADASQLKQYDIVAERGSIFAFDGTEQVPIVLNEQVFNIVTDPQVVTDRDSTASELARLFNLNVDELKGKLYDKESRYEIIAKKQNKDIKNTINQMVKDGVIDGVFVENTNRRVYPQASIAASVLGFVDDEGLGKNGIEQAENDILNGENGKVKALTDRYGIPLLAEGNNILIDSKPGEDLTLTLDVAMQKQLEALLKKGLEEAKSEAGDIIIMNPNNGQIKAMASYPTYDPAKFADVEDTSVFNNSAVSTPLEPGSVMKILTTAAAIDTKSVTTDQTHYDPSQYKVDGSTIRNVEEDGGAAVRSVSDVLRYSLNTGATWLLMQMGGGELNEQGRTVWHDYMMNHYRFSQATNVEQGYEEPGVVPDPKEGFGLNIKFANTTFGQGVTVTPLQMAAAVSAVVNGGKYYQPTLVAGSKKSDGEFVQSDPIIINENVVSPETSRTLIDFMKTTVAGNNYSKSWVRDGYIVGGKTGTAEIANPDGGYYTDRHNGTYVGFVGGDSPDFVIMVRVVEPKNGGYAGARAAAPIFGNVANMLIDNFAVPSASN